MTGYGAGRGRSYASSTGGLAVAAGGAVRDLVSSLAMQGALGEALQSPVTGYSVVYHAEIYMLFAALIAIGPLVRSSGAARQLAHTKFGLAELPG